MNKNFSLNLIASIFLLLFLVSFVSSQNIDYDSIISAFRFYKDIDSLSIKVPTVIEVPFEKDFIELPQFAVLDKTANSFVPYYFKQEILINETPVSVSTVPNVSDVNNMIDKNIKTYTEFLLPENGEGQAQIILSSSLPITSSMLTILLDNNVALPNSIEIRALVNGQSRIVVAKQKMLGLTIRFPQTTSDNWQITFYYSQPLRITEIKLNQDNATKVNIQAVRFLAQPNHSYRVYFNPDRSVNIPTGESGNLASAKEVLIISRTISSRDNPKYIIADTDNDKIPNIYDNCVTIYNPDQKDINSNNRGDACDDFDQDGIINSQDNCPNYPNQNQLDTDSDGLGDACDAEESRITERYPWLPWLGLGAAFVIIITLFILTTKQAK